MLLSKLQGLQFGVNFVDYGNRMVEKRKLQDGRTERTELFDSVISESTENSEVSEDSYISEDSEN